MGEDAGQGFTKSLIQALRALAAAHHQQNGLAALKTGQLQPLLPFTQEKLRPQRGAGQYTLGRQGFGALGKGGRNLLSESCADAVGQTRCQVTFVGEHGDTADPAADDHRHRYKAPLAEADIGLDLSDQADALDGTPYDPKRVCQVLPVEIAAQLARLHGMKCERLVFHQLPLDAGASDVVDIKAGFFELWDERQVGRHMPRRTAACEYDCFHCFSSTSGRSRIALSMSHRT